VDSDASSTPAAKRKKLLTPRLIDSDSDSSDNELIDTRVVAPKKPPAQQGTEQSSSSVWKIDRLKASFQKPLSTEPPEEKPAAAAEPPAVKKDASAVTGLPGLKKETPAAPESTSLKKKQSSKDIIGRSTAAADEEQAKDKARKEEGKHDMEKHEKKLSPVELSFSKLSSETSTNEDCSHKDSSSRKSSKHIDGLLKPVVTEKGSKTDAKKRPGFVIPKLKKPSETSPFASTMTDTWSDMRKRGAELERNRPKQMATDSSGMRRIPKVFPKGSLCGKEDVGVLDKIEQHPGFLRWQQQSGPQKNTLKAEHKRISTAARSIDDRSPGQPSPVSAVADNKRPKPLSMAATLAQLQAPQGDSERNSASDRSPRQPSYTGSAQKPPKPLSISATLAQLSAGNKTTDDMGSKQHTSPMGPVNKRPSKPLSIAATLAQLQNVDNLPDVESTDDFSPVKPAHSAVSSKPPKPLSIAATLAQLAAGDVADERGPRQPSSMVQVQPLMSSLIPDAPSQQPKKVLLPTPDDGRLSSVGAAPIPVVMGRGLTPSRGRVSSSPTNDNGDHFLQDESAGHPG